MRFSICLVACLASVQIFAGSFFSDDFNRPNAANLGTGWEEFMSGTFEIKSGQLEAHAPGGGGAIYKLRGYKNYRVRMKIVQISNINSKAVLFGRGIHSGYFSYDFWCGIKFCAINITAGNRILDFLVTNSTAGVKNGDIMEFELKGMSLQGFVNGLLVAKAIIPSAPDPSDDGEFPGVKVFSCTDCIYDDFEVETIP